MSVKCCRCKTIIREDPKRIRDHYAREHNCRITDGEIEELITQSIENPPNARKLAGKVKKKKPRVHKSPTGKFPDYDVGKGRSFGSHKGVYQGGLPGLGKGKS